jgi:M6 family metalloprotease-like protein
MTAKKKSACKHAALVLIIGSALSACTKRIGSQAYTNCKLPIADGDVGISLGGFPRNANRLQSTGTVNATVIMVDFSDAVATKTPAEAYALISGATATFTEMSYSQMQYTMTPTLQWFRMSKASNQYDFSSGHREYIQEAVDLADSVVDFSATDSLVILANPDSTGIGSRGPAMAASPGNGIVADGNEMLNAVTSAYDLNTWGSIWLNHEVSHTLGLVDLYAYKPKSDTFAGTLPYTGAFSYMGYNSFEANAPALTAWERWLLGWIDDSQILCANPRSDGEINTLITPIGVTGGQKAVVIPVSETKVVVVESRRASGIDANIAKTGALVYTVDSSIQSGYGPMNVYPRGGEDDPSFVQSIRAAGESAVASGMKVEVVSSEAAGDTVKITAEDFWIEKD